MEKLSRRTIIRLFGTTAIVPLLARCAQTPATGTGTTTPPTTPSWLAFLQSIGATINAGLTEAVSVGLGGSGLVTAQGIVGAIVADINQLGALPTIPQGQSTLTTVEDYINELAPIISPFLSLIPGGSIISLIIAGLPEEEALLNVASSLLPIATALAKSAPSSPAPAIAGQTPAQLAFQQLLHRAGRG